MPKLKKSVYWDFVVCHPEKGDVAAMESILAKFPEHHDELMFGHSSGVDNGDYSVFNYSTWLCQFKNYKRAKKVVRWLLKKGHTPDFWTAMALENENDFRGELKKNPKLANAVHPLFKDQILEMVSRPFQRILIEYGADISKPETLITIGEVDKVFAMIRRGQIKIDQGQESMDLLHQAITCRQDALAEFLLDKGASPTKTDDGGYNAVWLACLWGCPKALRKSIVLGGNPKKKYRGRSLLTWTIQRSYTRARVVDILLKAGVPIPLDNFEGETVFEAAERKGLDSILAKLKLAAKNQN